MFFFLFLISSSNEKHKTIVDLNKGYIDEWL